MLRAQERLRQSLVPRYHQLFTQISRLEGGVKFLVDLRADILVLESLLVSYFFFLLLMNIYLALGRTVVWKIFPIRFCEITFILYSKYYIFDCLCRNRICWLPKMEIEKTHTCIQWIRACVKCCPSGFVWDSCSWNESLGNHRVTFYKRYVSLEEWCSLQYSQWVKSVEDERICFP